MIRGLLHSYFIAKFFKPHNDDTGSPADHGIAYEDVSFPTVGGRRLHGFFMKPMEAPRGTIVHCHGNSGNVQGQYKLSAFLAEAGYNVLVFDYRGFGLSEGRPSPEGLIEDARASLTYLRTRPDVDEKKVALFGQSLGGTAASGTMVKEPWVRSLILEGTFTTYRRMAYTRPLGRRLFFLTPWVIPDIGPFHDLPLIAPRPVLIIHGDADEVVPVKFAPLLHAQSPATSFLKIFKGVSHLPGPEGLADYQNTILEFLEKSLR